MSTAEQPRAESQHRQRLLEALAESIRERGLRATQITDIVRLARTSRRTFYECFSDKEACFVALVREATTVLLADIEAAIDPRAPWTVQVDQALDRYLQALDEDPAMTATLSRELPALGLRGAAVQREGIERYAQLVVRMAGAERMREAGVHRPTLATAVMLVGGLSELVIHSVERGEPVREVGNVAKDVFKAVLAPGA
jgi:AcrR family transcriptional regulator